MDAMVKGIRVNKIEMKIYKKIVVFEWVIDKMVTCPFA